jgi:hypothetical protein
VHRVPGAVGEDLHLDVARPLHGLLEEDAGVAERAARLAHGLGERRGQLAASRPGACRAAAARDRLHEDREADLLGLRDERVDVVGAGRAQHRHARGDRVLLRGHLVARHLERARRRPMKTMPFSAARAASSGSREEAVAGVDRVRAAGRATRMISSTSR